MQALRRGAGGVVGRWLNASLRWWRLRLLFRPFFGPVSKLDLALTDLLPHLSLGFLIFGIVNRRTIKGLAEPGERHLKTHGLLLHVHGSDDHLLALAHLVEDFLGQLHLDLTAHRKADGKLQLNRLGIIDLDLYAERDDQCVGGCRSDQQGLPVLAFNAAHDDNDLHAPGIGVEPLVFDEANLLVASLLVLLAELLPCRPRLNTSRWNAFGCRSGGGRCWSCHRHLRLRYWLAFLCNRQRRSERERKC